jgi:ubiquinone biosynthesis protein
VAEPVVREWIERHLGPTGRIEDAAKGTLGFLGSVPSLLTRSAALVEHLDEITRDGLVLAPEIVDAMGKAQTRVHRWTAVAHWLIVVLLIWIVWRLV